MLRPRAVGGMESRSIGSPHGASPCEVSRDRAPYLLQSRYTTTQSASEDVEGTIDAMSLGTMWAAWQVGGDRHKSRTMVST